MGLFDLIFGKKKTSSNSSIENEYNKDSLHIKEFHDGSLELSVRKDQGMVDDERHYTDTVETVKQLKREKKHDEAIELLLKAVNATENESKEFEGWGVAPWYYEQLAIIYRKEKMYHKEVEILERYVNQKHTRATKELKLFERLDKAKKLLEKNIK
jgi:tetratricopeptide (TPR) repeat protein